MNLNKITADIVALLKFDAEQNDAIVSRPHQDGLSLRDWFAGQSISGLINQGHDKEEAARLAYSTSDALLRARLDRDGAALGDIASERQRQIEGEGWTPEHDGDEHQGGELGRAAISYILGVAYIQEPKRSTSGWPWPWSLKWWKPSDKRRNLVKAGALIVAEIERLDRADAASRLRAVSQP